MEFLYLDRLENALEYGGNEELFLELLSLIPANILTTIRIGAIADNVSTHLRSYSIIYRVACNGWWDIVRQLSTDYYWDPENDCVSYFGSSILHLACGYCDTIPADHDTIKYLTTTLCLDPLRENRVGETPLSISKGDTRQYFQKLVDDSRKEGYNCVVDFLRDKKGWRDKGWRDKVVAAALAEGGGDLSQCNIFLHGPPGAGKSSLKRVMLGQDPLSNKDQTSTDIVEHAVRAITTDKVKEFKVIGNDELINMLAEEVNSHHHNAITQRQVVVQSGTQSTSNHTPVKSNAPVENDNLADVPSCKPKDVVLIDVQTKTSSVLSIKERLDRATGPVKIYDSSWHNVVDSGGQPQFMDILPLVYRSPSLNIVVVRLTEGLDVKPKVCFYEEGRNVYTLPNRLLMSNRDLIIRMCQIAASRYASRGVAPYVMIVGTHLDKLGWFAKAKVLREFNQGLTGIRKEFSNVLICRSVDEVIFPINTMAKGKERQEYTKELQECITSVTREHESPVRVPLRWLVYQLDLDGKDRGVVRMRDCYKCGKVLGMKSVDVENALKFFSDMALILYFPKDIPDLVLTKMDPLIGKLSKLLKSSFIPPKFCPQAESERLRNKGLFNRSYLSKVLKNIESSDLSNEEFLMILQCLKIIVCAGKDEFFLPSALSLEPVGEQSPFEMSSVPLVFSWGEHFLPHGFFFTVAVELLGRDGDYRFELRSDLPQWRQEIQVKEASGKIPGVVKLTNRMKWIQVSSSSSNANCQAIYKEVNIAVQKSITRFQHTGIGPPLVASLCPLCKGGDHYCLMSANKKEFTCIVNNCKTGLVSQEMSCWFEVDQLVVSVPPLAPPRSLPTTDDQCVTVLASNIVADQSSVSIMPLVDDSTLLASDLVDVLRSVVAVSDWFSLGLALGLPSYELERVRRDGYDERDRLTSMLSMWLNRGTASWKSLVQALLDPLVNKTDIAQMICEQHPLRQ